MKICVWIVFLVFGLAFNQEDCSSGRTPKPTDKSSMSNKNPGKISDMNFDRLPDGVKATDKVREEIKDEKGEVSYQIITVAEKLKDLGARYREDELVDRNGRAIRFYRPPIRGTSQGYDEDQRQRAADEKALADLKAMFTVITIYEDPLKVA